MKKFLLGVVLAALALATSAAYHVVNKDWVLYRQAEHFVTEGALAKAIPLYNALSAREFKGDGQLQFRLAGLYENQGDHASAAAIYGSLLKREPGNRAIRIRLARSLTALGRYDEAILAYKMILGEKP